MQYSLACFSLLFVVFIISQDFPSIPEEKIPTNSTAITNGKILFEIHCTQCHKIFEKQIGAPLAYIYRFYDYTWLNGFITNSQQMVTEGDELAVEIFNSYNKVKMPSHDLSEEEVWNILGYIKEVSETRDYNEYFNLGTKELESSQGNKTILQKYVWVLVPLVLLSILTIFIIYRKKE